MPYPIFPNKHDEPTYVSASQTVEYLRSRLDQPLPPPPKGVVLCYQAHLWDAICDEAVSAETGFRKLRTLKATDHTIGVAGGLGIGAPAVSSFLELLIAYGVTQFISIGTAGGLQPDMDIADFIICERAIRDEGTSYHYLPPAKYAPASEPMTTQLVAVAEKRGVPYQLGTSWTVDAPYRETQAEVHHYQQEGVATVEMEASAVFAVATHHGVEMGSMFTISDTLTGQKWRPEFGTEAVNQGLDTIFEIAVESLSASNC